MGGTRSTYRRDKKSHLSTIVKFEGRRTLGRPRLKWKDNIKSILNIADY